MAEGPDIAPDSVREPETLSDTRRDSARQVGPGQHPARRDFGQSKRVYNELALGQRRLSAIFGSSAPRSLKAGEIAGTVPGWGAGIYNLRAGWACQFRDLANGCRAIV